MNERKQKIYTEYKLSEFNIKKASLVSGFKIAVKVFDDCLCVYRDFYSKKNIQMQRSFGINRNTSRALQYLNGIEDRGV